jgi:fibronectin-binding autotransporter adhesin
VPTTADDVFFDATSSGTCTIATGNTGARSINCTGFTGTITGTGAITVAGSITLVSGMTYSHTGTVTITGTGTLTTAGQTFSSVTVNGSGITVTLGDALSTAPRNITLTQGTFDAANYNVTCAAFLSSNSNTRTLTMGSGLWTLSGIGTVWNTATSTGLTFNKDTADILLSSTTLTPRTFAGGGLTYNKLTIGGSTGASATTVGAGTFTELASTKTVAHTIRFAGTITIGTWSITGTAGNVVTVNSTATGTQRTLNLTNATSGIDYLAVQDISVSQASRFYVGANSTDNGNNSNVIFTAAPTVANTGNFFMLFN